LNKNKAQEYDAKHSLVTMQPYGQARRESSGGQ